MKTVYTVLAAGLLALSTTVGRADENPMPQPASDATLTLPVPMPGAAPGTPAQAPAFVEKGSVNGGAPVPAAVGAVPGDVGPGPGGCACGGCDCQHNGTCWQHFCDWLTFCPPRTCCCCPGFTWKGNVIDTWHDHQARKAAGGGCGCGNGGGADCGGGNGCGGCVGCGCCKCNPCCTPIYMYFLDRCQPNFGAKACDCAPPCACNEGPRLPGPGGHAP